MRDEQNRTYVVGSEEEAGWCVYTAWLRGKCVYVGSGKPARYTHLFEKDCSLEQARSMTKSDLNHFLVDVTYYSPRTPEERVREEESRLISLLQPEWNTNGKNTPVRPGDDAEWEIRMRFERKLNVDFGLNGYVLRAVLDGLFTKDGGGVDMNTHMVYLYHYLSRINVPFRDWGINEYLFDPVYSEGECRSVPFLDVLRHLKYRATDNGTFDGLDDEAEYVGIALWEHRERQGLEAYNES